MENNVENNFVAKTLAEVYEYIEQYKSMLFIDEYSKVKVFYRGQSDFAWGIEPSCKRQKVEIKESQLLSTYKLDDNMSFFEKIAYIQHYHPGTRFVDFTVNPDVALYFACNKDEDADGAFFIWSYAPDSSQWYRIIVFEELLSIEQEEDMSIREFAERLYNKYEKIRERFDNVSKVAVAIISFIDNGFMIMPEGDEYEKNIRLKRQEGCFYICGVKFEKQLESYNRWESNAGENCFKPHEPEEPEIWKEKEKTNKSESAKELDITETINESYKMKESNNTDNFKDEKWSLIKILIPKESKKDILNELKEKGITMEYLMPDL